MSARTDTGNADIELARALIAGFVPAAGRYIVPMPADIRGASLSDLERIGFEPFDLSVATPSRIGIYALPAGWYVTTTSGASYCGSAVRAATIRLLLDGSGRLRALMREPADGVGAGTLVMQRRYTVADRILHGGHREIGIADGGEWMHRVSGADAEQRARALLDRVYPLQAQCALAYWDDATKEAAC